MHPLAIVIFLILFAISLPAKADETQWSYRFSPYLWFADIEGEINALTRPTNADFYLSKSEPSVNSDVSAVMMFFEAKRGRHGLLLDLLYIENKSDITFPQFQEVKINSTSKATVTSVSYVFQFYDSERTNVDLTLGLRYWDINSDVKFTDNTNTFSSQQLSNSESWVDPLIGVKAKTSLGASRFYLVGWLGVGAKGGADHFYDTSVNIGYQWNESIGTLIGYRQFGVDYEDGLFKYDIEQSGWVLGLTWGF